MIKAQTDPKIWIVIPAYNEAERIDRVLRGLKTAGYQNIVVVDDGSADNTADMAANCDVCTLRHLVNRGQGAALATGLQFARQQGADIVVTFDSDNQHDPREVASVIQPILDGQFDVVLGSRFLGSTENIPLARKFLLKAATVFTRLTSGLPLTDTHNGFRAFSKSALAKIQITEDRMAHASEILNQIGKSKVRWTESPVTIRYSSDSLDKGQSNFAAIKIVMRLIFARLVR